MLAYQNIARIVKLPYQAKKGFIVSRNCPNRLYKSELSELSELIEIVKFCKNCDILLKMENMVDFVKFGKKCEMCSTLKFGMVWSKV